MRRPRTRALGFGICLMAALNFAAGPVAGARPEAPPEPPLSRSPHPVPPTGPQLERLVALNDHPGVDEQQGDFTTMVVTHTVWVKIAADEEWRTYYGANAFNIAGQDMEKADDAMYSMFGIDLVRYQTANWDSSPDSGVDACGLLDDLKNDLNPGSSELLLGFAKNSSTNYAGCAEINGDEAEVNWNSSSYNRWVTTQHEVSHIFAAQDRYPDTLNIHTLDVMENQFDKPDYWCTYFQGSYTNSDNGLIYDHSAKFG